VSVGCLGWRRLRHSAARLNTRRASTCAPEGGKEVIKEKRGWLTEGRRIRAGTAAELWGFGELLPQPGGVSCAGKERAGGGDRGAFVEEGGMEKRVGFRAEAVHRMDGGEAVLLEVSGPGMKTTLKCGPGMSAGGRKVGAPIRETLRMGHGPKPGLGQMDCPRPAFVFFFVLSFSIFYFLVCFTTFAF
jgi:hypothetical protein